MENIRLPFCEFSGLPWCFSPLQAIATAAKQTNDQPTNPNQTRTHTHTKRLTIITYDVSNSRGVYLSRVVGV